jgi:predicted dehydrogenase
MDEGEQLMQSTQGNKFGVGIIGCGGVSVNHFRAYRALPDECEIIAVSDVSEANARRFMQEYSVADYYADWRELLRDERIQVVSLCTPHNLHAPMTIAAARAGKNVLCEKPMAITVGQCHEMIEACRAHGVKLSVGSERINPRQQFLKERVLPELGEVAFSYAIHFHYRNTAYYQLAPWRGTWAQEGGGVCANQATYIWDQWQWFLGGVDYAYGYWANLLHPSIEVEDLAYGLVHFKNGSYGKFLATSICDRQDEIGGLFIEAQNGSIFARDYWGYEIDFALRDARLDEALHADFEKVIDPAYHGRFQSWQIGDLFAAIREDRAPLTSEVMDAIKILNGLHWNGWTHAAQFKEWAQRFDLPPSVEEGYERKWNGGALIDELAAIVQTPDAHLAAPFLEG